MASVNKGSLLFLLLIGSLLDVLVLLGEQGRHAWVAAVGTIVRRVIR